MTRAAIYARISTADDRQTLTNQLRELQEYAARSSWEIVATFTDQLSGAAKARPGLEQLMEAASRRQFEIVLIWDLSRLTRKGPASAFELIERLKASGVDLHSYREEYFRTAGPLGAVLIAVAAFFAEYERSTMQARIKAGLDRARSEGVTLGRPEVVNRELVRQIRNHHQIDHLSIRQIAEQMGLKKSTVGRIVRSNMPQGFAVDL